jgi:hypothetical protein
MNEEVPGEALGVTKTKEIRDPCLIAGCISLFPVAS